MKSCIENISSVDDNGFLVEGEEKEKCTSNDQAKDASRYDLSTLETTDTLFVDFSQPVVEDQTTEKEMDEDAIAMKKKMEEESLLEGNDDSSNDDCLLTQKARITLYNQYLPDSESEEEDEDYTAQEDCEEEKSIDDESSVDLNDPENDNYEYACLHESHESDTEDSSGQEDDKGNNENMHDLTANEKPKETETEQLGMKFNEADPVGTKDSNNDNTTSSQANEVKERNRNEAYSNSVPLLKPIPADKMGKFLKSKGLVTQNDSSIEKDDFIADFAQFGSFSHKEE